jgi:hypothetical protein
VKVKFHFLPSQRIACEDIKSKYIFYSGGLGSGKTHCLFQKMTILSRFYMSGAGGLLFPSFQDYKRDFLPILEREFAGIKYQHNRQENWFRFPWMKNRSDKIFIFTAEKPLAGPNLAWLLINEFSLIKWDRIKEGIQRVRLKVSRTPQICFFGTPEDRYGWVSDFIDTELKERPDKIKILNVSTRENRFINDDYADQISSHLDARQREIFLNGMIVPNIDNAFYYCFKRSENLTDKNLYQKDIPIHIGLDFNAGFMTASASHIVDNKCFVFKEWLLKNYSSDTKQMMVTILTDFPDSEIFLYPDASAKARSTNGLSNIMAIEEVVKELRASGSFRGKLEILFTRANPRLRDRQLLINNLFEKKRIIIQNDLKVLIKDLEKVEQSKLDYTKEKKKDETLTHMSDAFDYKLYYLFGHELNLEWKSKQIN